MAAKKTVKMKRVAVVVWLDVPEDTRPRDVRDKIRDTLNDNGVKVESAQELYESGRQG